MSNYTNSLPKGIYTSMSQVRYGLHTANSGREIFAGLCTFARAWAHNPFGSNDQFNRKLRDRDLEYLANVYKKNGGSFVSRGNECPAHLKELEASFKRIYELTKLEGKSLGVLAETCIGKKDEFITAVTSQFVHSDEGVGLGEELRTNLLLKQGEDRVLASCIIIRDLIEHLKKQGNADVTWEMIVSKEIGAFNFRDMSDRKVDEQLFKDAIHMGELPFDEFKRVQNAALKGIQATAFKSDLVVGLGLFTLEAILSIFSSDFLFSLINSYGIASFAACLFAVLTTLPYTVALMESVRKQFNSFRTEGGPMTLADPANNIRQHMRNSWDKAVNSDTSFHPVVDAFLDTLFVMSTWTRLASWGIASHAIYYLFLDGYLSAKSSFILGKETKMAVRDFLSACFGGIIRGLIQNLLRASIFAHTIYDTMITYICALIGHLAYIGSTRALSVERMMNCVNLANECIQSLRGLNPAPAIVKNKDE